MEQTEATAQIPKSLPAKKQLLRTLMNVWEPQQLSDDFLVAQDAELQMQLKDKGVIRTRKRLWQGDITRLKVDAIVNAANPRGLGCWNPLHPCVDNDIHSAAGLQLRQECNNILQKRKSKKRYTMNDRFSVEKSKEMFILIQSYFNRANDVEHAIRSWNGGQHYSRKATQRYFEKVMRHMK